MISAILLLLALILAPVIGGGFGELTNGILQILIFTAVILHIWTTRKEGAVWLRVPGFIPLAVFLAAVVISVVFTESIYSSLKQLLFLCACLSGYMLASTLGRNRKIAAFMLWGTALSALSICLFGIRDYAISTGGGVKFWQALLSSGDHMRLFGTFINPGFFAGYLVITIPITLGLYLVTRRAVFAVLAGLAFVTQALAILLTGTKFGIASLAAALLVFFILAIITKSLNRDRLKRLLLIAVISLPLLLVFSSPFTSRVREAGSGGTQAHSAEFRKYAWQSTVNMIRDNALTGVGPGVYDIAYTRYAIAGPTKYAHQSYLQMAAESGIIAIAAFIAALFSVAYAAVARILKYTNKISGVDDIWEYIIPTDAWRLLNCAIFAAITGSAIRSLVDSDWYIIGIALPFWILMGVLVSRVSITDNGYTAGKIGRIWQTSVCGILILLSISFGFGDFITSSDKSTDYSIATVVSPLNPKYYREHARHIPLDSNAGEAVVKMKKAIRLAPTDAVNYYTLGIIYLRLDQPKSAITQFEKTLEFNPNSTQTLYQLAQTYNNTGNIRAYESTLRRLLKIENTLYEQVKGAPEIVDNTFAFAHEYFAVKYLEEKDYAGAVREFKSAIERLERWRSNKQILEMARASGLSSEGEEAILLGLLQDCYLNLADAYEELGDEKKAEDARAKSGQVGSDFIGGETL